MRSELVEKGPDVVDEPRMVAREQLERDQRRAAARGALVLDPAPQELRLLSEAELANRAVRDRALPVVDRARRALELVLPTRPEVCELTLGALAGELVRLRGG